MTCLFIALSLVACAGVFFWARRNWKGKAFPEIVEEITEEAKEKFK